MEDEFKICIEDGSEPLPQFVVSQNTKSLELHDWQRRGLDFFFMNDCKAIFQCATGCIVGDTYIDMPRDLIQHPLGIKIKDLVGKKDFYIYTFNIKDRKIELKKAKNVWFVRNDDVYEITLWSGKKIKATANHLFLVNITENIKKGKGYKKIIRYREYRRLDELKIDDFLTTFNRPFIWSKKDGEYIKVKYDNNKRRVLEHRFIGEQIFGKLGIHDVVHHKDKNKFNNSIDNLEIQNCFLHNSMHTKERGFYGKKLWRNGEHPRGMLGKHIERGDKKYHGSKEFLENGFNSYLYKTNKIESCKRCSDTLNKKGKKFLSERALYGAYTRYIEKIKSIQYVGKEDVFDMEVEDNHNFVANGFIIHNSGKSRFAIEVLKRLMDDNPNLKTLIVVPKNIILEATWYPELYESGFSFVDIGVFYGAIKEYGKVTITNMQNITKIDFKKFDFVIFDEVHNYATDRILPFIRGDTKYKLALSATLERIDRRHYMVLEAFGYNLFEYNAKEALQDGVLNPFRFYNVSVEMDEESFDRYQVLTQHINSIMQAGGGYSKIMASSSGLKLQMLSIMNDRKQLVNNYPRKMDVIKMICDKYKDDKFVVFQEYNKQTSMSYWHLLDIGVKACVVHSGIPTEKREQNLDDFKKGKYNCILASRVLDEGWNVPAVDTAIIVAGNSTSRQTIQRMGRVLRRKNKPSKLFQIFCQHTIEEEYSEKRAVLFKELCSGYNEYTYSINDTGVDLDDV